VVGRGFWKRLLNPKQRPAGRQLNPDEADPLTPSTKHLFALSVVPINRSTALLPQQSLENGSRLSNRSRNDRPKAIGTAKSLVESINRAPRSIEHLSSNLAAIENQLRLLRTFVSANGADEREMRQIL